MLPSSPPARQYPGRAITFHRDDTERDPERIFLTRARAPTRSPCDRSRRARPCSGRVVGAVQPCRQDRNGAARARTEPSRPAARWRPCVLAPSAHPHRPQLPAPRRARPAPPPPQSRGDNPAARPPFYLQQPAAATSTLRDSRAEHGAKRGAARRSAVQCSAVQRDPSSEQPRSRLAEPRARACLPPPPSSHGGPPRVPPPGRRAARAALPRRGGGEGAQGRVLRRDVPGGRGDRPGGHGARARPRGPQRRLRHAPPVPRLLRQRVRRVGADGRHADDARREGRAVQHQLPALVRGRRRDQGGAGGALPRRRLLRRHRRHGRPRRRRPDRWAQLGGAARARGQPDGEPGGLGQHHAEPARQRQRAHPPLRGAQPQRHRPRRALRFALHRRGPLLLHRLPPLQPVGLRPPRPQHGRRLPPRARRALPQGRRRGGHGRHGRHPARLRQPLLQGPRRPPRLPQLRPDALLRQRQDPPRRQALQRGPGRLLQGLRRGDGQDGRAAEPQEGGDTA